LPLVTSVKLSARSMVCKGGNFDCARIIPTSVQGSPISLAVDGRQYIVVIVGVGGTSRRPVPSYLSQDIRYPSHGNTMMVFARPE